MLLTTQAISILRKVLIGCSFCLLLITFFELAFIGKNITFTTRFTPPQSQENHLRNQTYITQAQVFIMILAVLHTFIVPLLTFAAMKKPKKVFIPLIITFGIINALLILLNLYFLIGASNYRSFMNTHYQNIVQNDSICSGNATLCIIGTCNRLQIFKQAKDMAISFVVIDGLFSFAVIGLCILCNQKRKSADKLELIV